MQSRASRTVTGVNFARRSASDFRTPCLMTFEGYRLRVKNRAAALGLSQSLPRLEAASAVSALPKRVGSPRAAER